MSGLVHLYCGDGKGKTTAAAGLALRCIGAGKRVLFVQFFKDGSSSELPPLRSLGADILICSTQRGFWWNMDAQTRKEATADYTMLLREALARAGDYGLLVLDEAVSACNHGAIPEEELLAFLDSRPPETEVVITGRDPSPALRERADYITEMRMRRHPYEQGVAARKGIEY